MLKETRKTELFSRSKADKAERKEKWPREHSSLDSLYRLSEHFAGSPLSVNYT